MKFSNNIYYHRYSCSAFTLVEVLVFITILSIAAIILIPSMTNVASFETEAAVRRLIADLSFAQTDAMARQNPRRVVFNEDGTGYRILGYPFDYDNDVLYDPLSLSESGLYIVNYGTDDRWQDISITNVDIDSGNAFITYDEIGVPVSSNGSAGLGGTMTVSGRDETWNITIAAFTGRISVAQVVN